MTSLPQVAPYDASVACFRGDTTTGLGIEGIAEAHIAVLVNAGIPLEQATATVELYCEKSLGCDHGMVPTESFSAIYRICEECAQKAGLRSAELAGEGVPMYRYEGEEEDAL